MEAKGFKNEDVYKLFEHLNEISNGNNILVRKNLVELILFSKDQIKREIEIYKRDIDERTERIRELNSCLSGLNIGEPELSVPVDVFGQ